ncbi:bifunctional (p)ppGpp synthetase/guanosine-3',5'-bis(diphosphate) 3'-pyrophosphohydrolase [Candidatus Kaiserbacteria bacterium]|nr:bifunctional (p)ppGpp synthetase/guanosine-3',5'-bis(diphosphate) 3'-pyrophosphohydrolase [Candidatus Kaiserbacteria bacterium]MCB9812032.1 bifunctional (p)ppGpp synthetase/guanosine-3',5'-bis(diphosphate) 3'-pyrophosphohydrolase [Candidatus Nomurabacteria bacterium]
MTTVKEIIAQMNDPTEADKQLIEKAYSLAEKAHEGATRYSGEPYFMHVSAVAFRLAQMGWGPRTIAAGLLHDTIEDTEVTAEDIRREFGDEILFLVEGVTKLSSVRYYGADRHNESLRKLFVATSQDIRVLIIKLVDRLHNMETLSHVPKEKQVRIARETLEIYVPVAHRLGIGRIRKELEDLAFPYVYPNEYEKVLNLMKQGAGKAEDKLEKERKALQKRLAEAGLRDFSTAYRVKGLYSLFQKLRRKEWDIDRIYDLLAIRVVVGNVEECYRVLGIIHEMWRPLPKRVKDYIAFPKPNGYQSIHTTVTSPAGTIMEIQIRTAQMHREAEYGVASHVMYKIGQSGQKGAQKNGESWFANLIPSLFRPFAWRAGRTISASVTKDIPPQSKVPLWIKQIGEMYTDEESTGHEFMQDMQKDFFHNRIFVFTPKGDVVDLPLGATPIDFAYAIHSEIGNQTSGAKVNSKLVSLAAELKNGDIVEIVTSKKAKPTHKWLEVAKTSIAKRKIRSALEELGAH